MKKTENHYMKKKVIQYCRLTSKTIYGYRRLRSVKGFANSSIQFVITNAAPKNWFTIHNRLRIASRTRTKTLGKEQ